MFSDAGGSPGVAVTGNSLFVWPKHMRISASVTALPYGDHEPSAMISDLWLLAFIRGEPFWAWCGRLIVRGKIKYQELPPLPPFVYHSDEIAPQRP